MLAQGFLGGGPEGPSWEDVEETLIAGDVGATLALDLVERARRRRDAGGSEAAVRAELASLLVARDPDWAPQPAAQGGPAVILVVGVNGTGKTTTIGKLAARFRTDGHSVLLAAADIWAIRRYSMRHFRQLRDDRRAMIERELAELRRERRPGRNGQGES